MGIVGAGQLARMTYEAASALGIPVVVLAADAGDAAALVAADVLVGRPGHRPDMEALADRADVITFDHEQVDLDILDSLAATGVCIRPGLRTLSAAVDKARMRTQLAAAGLPVPPFAVLGSAPGLGEIESFGAQHGWPLILKAATGGYDGAGVWPVADRREADDVRRRAAGAGTPLLAEQLVPLDAELAVLVARRPGGEAAVWPAVETAQLDGVCREVLVPGRVGRELGAAAEDLALRVAAEVGATGVLAVELFWAGGDLLVNEIAARPHNSGHWTIEGSVTSQFENHLRAVLDYPLGDTSLRAPQVASVNLFGPADGRDPSRHLADGLAVPGAHVHLYGKSARPQHKLGHVTVAAGDDPLAVRATAWRAARRLGTEVPPSLSAADPDGDGPR